MTKCVFQKDAMNVPSWCCVNANNRQVAGSFRVEVSAGLGENTLETGPHTTANINIKPTTSSEGQAYALQLAALQLLKKGMLDMAHKHVLFRSEAREKILHGAKCGR